MAEILKDVFEDEKGNQHYIANNTETTFDQNGTPLNNGGDLSEASVNFTVSTARKALTAKARFKALLGDIAKWLTDLGTAAFKNVANNDTTTVDGFVADARIVKTHGDEIDGLYQNLASGQIEFSFQDGKGVYRKKGADTWFPFSGSLVLMNGTASYAYSGVSGTYAALFELDNFDFSNYRQISIKNLANFGYEVTCGTKVFSSDGTYDVSDLKAAKLKVMYHGNVGNPPIQLRIELIP